VNNTQSFAALPFLDRMVLAQRAADRLREELVLRLGGRRGRRRLRRVDGERRRPRCGSSAELKLG